MSTASRNLLSGGSQQAGKNLGKPLQLQRWFEHKARLCRPGQGYQTGYASGMMASKSTPNPVFLFLFKPHVCMCVCVCVCVCVRFCFFKPHQIKHVQTQALLHQSKAEPHSVEAASRLAGTRVPRCKDSFGFHRDNSSCSCSNGCVSGLDSQVG